MVNWVESVLAELEAKAAGECMHEGTLVEIPELGELQCEVCKEMFQAYEKHFG